MPLTKGMVHVYTGNGKGKTTSSFGLALRASGHDLRVAVVQFLKASGYSGEVLAARRFVPNIKVFSFGKKCPNASLHEEQIARGSFQSFCKECFSTTQEEREEAKEALEYARRLAATNEFDVIILDEVNVALSKSLVSLDEVMELVKNRKPNIELVLTGRNAPQEIIELADFATEMRCIKHVWDAGMPARPGIEF